jgi:hypothetical protein
MIWLLAATALQNIGARAARGIKAFGAREHGAGALGAGALGAGALGAGALGAGALGAGALGAGTGAGARAEMLEPEPHHVAAIPQSFGSLRPRLLQH